MSFIHWEPNFVTLVHKSKIHFCMVMSFHEFLNNDNEPEGMNENIGCLIMFTGMSTLGTHMIRICVQEMLRK